MEIKTYFGEYDNEIISLILSIQNDENKLGLSLQEQQDLLNIHGSYQAKGGEFWIAFSQGKVIGTIGLIMKANHCAVLKKFFVDAAVRSHGVGAALYQKLLAFAKNAGIEHIILDTPSIAHAAHRFYEHAGFYQIQTEQLPVPYTYPDRDCILYMLDL